MFISKTEPKLAVPFAEGTVITVLTAAGQTVDLLIDNLHATNTVNFKWQSSADGSTWVDVAVSADLAASTRNITVVAVALATHYRLRASGNLDVAVKVDTEVAFASDFTFGADGKYQTKTEPNIDVADTSSTFVTQFTLSGLAAQVRRVSVKNTGAVQLDGIKFQSSPDNASWTDVAGSVALAGGSTLKFSLSGSVFYRLQVNTAGTDIGVKLDAELFNTNKTLAVSTG